MDFHKLPFRFSRAIDEGREKCYTVAGKPSGFLSSGAEEGPKADSRLQKREADPMYCTHCSNQIEEGAAVCMKCGFAVGSDRRFCPACGAETEPGQAVCTSCGHLIPVPVDSSKQKSRLVAGLLALLCGVYGVHNFYLGNTGKAVAQLVMTLIGLATCWLIVGVFPILGAAIWSMVEGILLFTGKIDVDSDGVPLKDSF